MHHRTPLAIIWALYVSLILIAWPAGGPTPATETPPVAAAIVRPDTPSDVPWGG